MNLHTVSGPLRPTDREAVRALVGRAAAVDGVAPLDEAALLALADARPLTTADGAMSRPPRHLLAFEITPRRTSEALGALTLSSDAASPAPPTSEDVTAGGRTGDRGPLIGYAQVDLGGAVPTAQLVVDPSARRRGVGRALLEAAAARRDAGAATPASAGPFEVWAHGDLPAARALAATAGFDRADELWRMTLDLRARPAVAPAWPPGLVVRPFAPGHDEEAWLAVNARAFAHHPDQGRWTAHDLAVREREPWFDPAGFLLAEREGGSLLGFVWTKVHPAGELADEPAGEIYVLGVDPSAQGAGLGRALTSAGLDHLVGRGLGTAVLWVAGDNSAAIHTYRRAGFERTALDVRYARRAADVAAPLSGATMGS